MHLWPSPLKHGDIVDIIAPSFGFQPDVIEEVRTVANSWGFKARIPDNIFGEDLLCANSDEIRFQHLKEALYNKDSRAIWSLRGGYGATRLFPMLNELPEPSQTKLVIGFSDITALHIFLNQKWGWPTLHACGARQIAQQKVSVESSDLLKSILFGEQKEGYTYSLKPLNDASQKTQSIQSSVAGGNLCLVQCSLGTFWQLDGKDKIILLEDVDEKGYRIDRMLNHLTQAGIFTDAKAVLFGDFTGGKEDDGTSLVEPVINRFANLLSIPALRIEGVGHGFVNRPVPLGFPVMLETGSDAKLSFFIDL